MDTSLISLNKENSIKTLGKLFFIFFSISFSGVTFAAQVSGLYQEVEKVASQSAQERQQAFALALNKVLVRISGKQSVIDNSELNKAISNPEQFVQKYSYETIEMAEPLVEADNRVTGQNGGTELINQYRLNVFFSRLAINNLLKEHGEPVWGSNRPTVLMWIATEDHGQRTVVGAASDMPMTVALKRAAKMRGVPLYLPVMDLQDESAINSSDIWGLFIDSLGEASARYSADSVVVGRIKLNSEQQWDSQWAFKLKGEVHSGAVTEPSLDEAAMVLVGSIAEKLSERYAVYGASEPALNSELELEISDVHTMEDYVGATRYLESLPPVSSSQLVWVKGDRIRFAVTLRGYLEQLQEHIELDTILSAEIAQSMDESDSFRLHYRWSKLN